jgi:hypothetical protein
MLQKSSQRNICSLLLNNSKRNTLPVLRGEIALWVTRIVANLVSIEPLRMNRIKKDGETQEKHNLQVCAITKEV